MRCPEEFFGEFIRYNIKKCKGKPSFIRINFSSYYITPINKNARFTHASGHLSDLHPGRYILVLLKCSNAALSLSQQQGTGKQQMENKLYICLEDICFSPALTELFLFIYRPPHRESVLFKGWRQILLLLKQNPEQSMDSWRAGCGVELQEAQSQIFTWRTVR